MAILDYMRSLAGSKTISKTQVFRFIEIQFARADRDHDGELDSEELAAFADAISRSEINER